jgi:hypothetical protein
VFLLLKKVFIFIFIFSRLMTSWNNLGMFIENEWTSNIYPKQFNFLLLKLFFFYKENTINFSKELFMNRSWLCCWDLCKKKSEYKKKKHPSILLFLCFLNFSLTTTVLVPRIFLKQVIKTANVNTQRLIQNVMR